MAGIRIASPALNDNLCLGGVLILTNIAPGIPVRSRNLGDNRPHPAQTTTEHFSWIHSP
jgi:hypothetical protein